MSWFRPDLMRRRITDVTAADLHERAVRLILLDVDNTLTPHYDQNVGAAVEAWLDTMRREGFALCLVSNSKAARVAPFAERIGLPYQPLAGKPLTGGFRRAAAENGVSPRECAVIGDQIFTDVVGAHWFGATAVLLEPISPESEKDRKFIRFKRWWERPLLRRYRRQHATQKENVT